MALKKIMWTTTLAAFMIVAGCVLLVLGSLPMENKVEGNELVVKFVIGKKVIDIKDAVVKPVPAEVCHDIIRVGGTSVGKKKSGNFKNVKTKTKYQFYLTGHGEKIYFEVGDTKYLVDGVKIQ